LTVEVVFTPSARVQFLSAIKTIRRNNQAAARKFRLQSEKSLKRLSRFPRSGAVILEFPELPYREIYVKPYRFFYRVRDDTVWIVALWHGAQLPDEPPDA
jgi:toxin ParE1/3/4